MSSFDSTVFGDFATREIQDAVRRFADGLDSRLLRGRMIEGLSFEAGETKLVAHGLGRADVRVMPVNVRTRPASFRAYLSADQTGISGASNVKVAFDTESWDYGSVFDVSTNTFTAPETAIYQFETVLWVASLAQSRYASPSLFAGGVRYESQFNLASDVTGSYLISATWKIALDASDTAIIEIFHNDTSETLRGSSPQESWFSGEIVGSPMPYIDEGSNANRNQLVPVHAERPLFCDLWVY